MLQSGLSRQHSHPTWRSVEVGKTDFLRHALRSDVGVGLGGIGGDVGDWHCLQHGCDHLPKPLAGFGLGSTLLL